MFDFFRYSFLLMFFSPLCLSGEVETKQYMVNYIHLMCSSLKQARSAIDACRYNALFYTVRQVKKLDVKPQCLDVSKLAKEFYQNDLFGSQLCLALIAMNDVETNDMERISRNVLVHLSSSDVLYNTLDQLDKEDPDFIDKDANDQLKIVDAKIGEYITADYKRNIKEYLNNVYFPLVKSVKEERHSSLRRHSCPGRISRELSILDLKDLRL